VPVHERHINLLRTAASRVRDGVYRVGVPARWSAVERRVYDPTGAPVLEALTPNLADYAALFHPQAGHLIASALEIEADRIQDSLNRSVSMYGSAVFSELVSPALLALARVVLTPVDHGATADTA
jgi:uncharacterized protein (DUF2342 family)